MWINNPKTIPGATPQAQAIVDAASLGLAVMALSKVRVWDDLPQPLEVDLTPDQRRTIWEFEHLVRLQRAKVDERAGAALACCTLCCRFVLLPTGSQTPSRCTLTRECSGKLIRAKAPARSKTDPGPYRKDM